MHVWKYQIHDGMIFRMSGGNRNTLGLEFLDRKYLFLESTDAQARYLAIWTLREIAYSVRSFRLSHMSEHVVPFRNRPTDYDAYLL